MSDTEQILASILNYARDRYMEESDRFLHLEEKAGKFLNLLSVVIGGFVAVSGFYFEATGRPTGAIGWLTFAFMSLTFIALASAWGHVLAALKIQDYEVPRNSDDAYEFMLSDGKHADKYILDNYRAATAAMSRNLESKERNLDLAFGDIALSGVLVALSVLIVSIREVILK